ncbi:type I secretion system permease/ATPase [Aestuariivirga sp.]|uniref:type I secretion system permease/ATPase n=1 Tax=Aestuariivirga sp. TaxID=2650926 RepID=UPI003919B880
MESSAAIRRSGDTGRPGQQDALHPDAGMACLCGIAAAFQVAADPVHLARELSLSERGAGPEYVVRAARLIGLKSRVLRGQAPQRMAAAPLPAIARRKEGGFVILAHSNQEGFLRIVDPVARLPQDVPADVALGQLEPLLILVQRRFLGAGADPGGFNIRWFLPSLLRYRKALGHVLLASLFIQFFALVSPLFFQVVVDKVLVHQSLSTLYVVVAGLVAVTIFDQLLQWMRTYALTHTTNRIDVELGQRLFAHMMRLPVGYFETRPAGQTVARVRELESIRGFLTGPALFTVLDILFGTIFLAVMLSYSVKLTLIVLVSFPLYFLIGFLIGPVLRERIMERFNRGAESQQFLIETVVGAPTVKAAAVEPSMRMQWEERLAAYVRTSFRASMTAATGQGMIQLVSRLTSAAIILFGAQAVINGEMTVGSLIAFNMFANHVSEPVLRLSQIWQEFQQVGISLARMGDILNTPPEPSNPRMAALPPPRGAIAFKRVHFRYPGSSQDVLKDISLSIKPGEMLAIVGPSGCGKSSLAKLVQRFYVPHEGQVTIDGVDLSQVDPSWLRMHIGVVLQENLLFNRSIHDNIALSNPALPRSRVIETAKLSGAHDFISKLPAGYDTMIEERGANLSGGQRQRIVIARALVTNPRILILDEATSALDYESERIIQRNMRQIAEGRTVIVIAHRLSTIRNADRIVGMLDGRIVETGTHAELIDRPRGLYARLWAMQSEGDQA